jgi:hypothetical protein
MNNLQKLIWVVVLLAIGYFLLPYVKVKPKPTITTNNNTAPTSTDTIKTFTSDNLSVSFKYNTDQDGDGKPDTGVKEAGDKIYVYYTAGPAQQGQWVQKFSKDPGDSLTDAIQKQFLKNYAAKDCYVQSLGDYYKSFEVPPPTLAANISEAVIAYPKPAADSKAPFYANATNCPSIYSASNGISYFYMNQNHPDKFYFFSIGQYGIIADTQGQKTWQDTVQITK